MQFHAHSFVLAFRAPALAQATISHLEPIQFQAILRWVYLDEVPPSELLHGMGAEVFLESAERFECIGLKLVVESELAKYVVITVDNAIE